MRKPKPYNLDKSVPNGLTLVEGRQLPQLCKKLDIPYQPAFRWRPWTAMTGKVFERKYGNIVGVLVPTNRVVELENEIRARRQRTSGYVTVGDRALRYLDSQPRVQETPDDVAFMAELRAMLSEPVPTEPINWSKEGF